MSIAGQDRDGVVVLCGVRQYLRAVAGFGFGLLPLLDAQRCVQTFEWEAFLDGELLRTESDKKGVWQMFHDAFGQGGGVADVLHAGDAAAAQHRAFHHAGIDGDIPGRVAESAEANRVDGRIIFHGLSAGNGGIQWRMTGRPKVPWRL